MLTETYLVAFRSQDVIQAPRWNDNNLLTPLCLLLAASYQEQDYRIDRVCFPVYSFQKKAQIIIRVAGGY